MDAQELDHRNKMLDIVARIPSGVPAGWEKTVYAVGSLMYLGFSYVQTEKLIVISSQKQSVIDCRTNTKLPSSGSYDEDELIALDDILGDEIVPLAGDAGGGLRRFSKEGNMLTAIAPYWPMSKIIFMPHFALYTLYPEKCTVIHEDYEIKAFGFSQCSNYLAIGTADSLVLLRKEQKK